MTPAPREVFIVAAAVPGNTLASRIVVGLLWPRKSGYFPHFFFFFFDVITRRQGTPFSLTPRFRHRYSCGGDISGTGITAP